MKADNVNGIARYIIAALLDCKFRRLLGVGVIFFFYFKVFPSSLIHGIFL